MANSPSPARDPDPPFPGTSFLAGFLSYLVPGLGQLYQGRVGKGLLFLICLYALFFYGMFLGTGTAKVGEKEYRITSNVYLPDSAPNNTTGGLSRLLTNLYNRPQFAGQFWIGIAAWPAVWQYLNYDDTKEGDPLLGTFQRTPDEVVINQIQRSGDKTWDLAWVYTVIAGVLNVLVIYDAYAGPLFHVTGARTGTTQGAKAA